MGNPLRAVRNVLGGLAPTDQLVKIKNRVLVLRDKKTVAIAGISQTNAGGWLVISTLSCASTRISRG